MAVRDFFQPSLRAIALALATFLGILPSLHAQGLQIQEAHAPINVLNISDVDFVNSGTPQWLFSIDVNASGRQINAYAVIDLRVSLATGQNLPQAFHLITRSFQVIGTRSFSNLDIGKGKAIRDSVYIQDPAAKRIFEDVALPSGQLPAGTYTFSFEVHETWPGSGVSKTSFAIVLTNPSSVELLFPSDGENDVNQFPLFQWLFDGTLSHIFVFEKLPSQRSLEEAAQGVPMVNTELSTTSYVYPTAGVRPLQPGHVYVWYIEGHVRSLGGRDQILRSPLRSFIVAEGPSSISSLLDELALTLDPKYKPIFDQIKAEGLSLSGVIRLNGSVISSSELLRLLMYLRKNPAAVESAGLE